MQIYLPIAELPVNIFVLLVIGLAVGFISGLFGVGGGFLMTPLLIFIGISPAVSVATVTSHIAASSTSSALSYWRKNAIDVHLALILLTGGTVGTVAGVWLFTALRSVDMLDLLLSISYVLMLGAVMGIGGGFILVPMLIYFLRVPTRTVVGTSTLLTLITMTASVILHAVTNHLVDAMLALILMVGGVIGAQFGARAGLVMRPERLRFFLGLLVLSVGVRFAVELFSTPANLYSIRFVASGA